MCKCSSLKLVYLERTCKSLKYHDLSTEVCLSDSRNILHEACNNDISSVTVLIIYFLQGWYFPFGIKLII